MKKKFRKNLLTFTVLIFVYILFTEFILPKQTFLPKLIILWEAFLSLNSDYNFFSNIIQTFGALYLGLILSFVLIYLVRNYVILFVQNFPFIFDGIGWMKYLLTLPTFVIFISFLPLNFLGELIASLLIFIFITVYFIFKEFPNRNTKYEIAALGLGVSNKHIREKVIYFQLLPGVVKKVLSAQLIMWSLLICVGFFSHSDSLGNILNSLINYNDVSGLIAYGISVGLMFLIGEKLTKFITDKFIFWEGKE